MTRRVLLHVGTPKTGTSYVQDVLFRNRDTLTAAGILYPAERFDAHFLAALDLMKLPWGGLEAEAIGAWDRLAERARAHRGTTIISHEILAHASRAQAGRALESLGHRWDVAPEERETEVHVVLSVRDLIRQVPAEWQENVKHRSTLSYAEFLDQIRDPERRSRVSSWFWAVQEIPAILDRWAHDLPPEHVHVVTVPPSGTAPEVLWKRFSRALDLDRLDLDLTATRANPSLGVPETALIRRINASANDVLVPGDYRPLIRELLAHQTLSQRRGSARLGLPPHLHRWFGEVEQSWVDAIRERGYDVIGDVSELLGASLPAEAALDDRAERSWADPDRPRPREVADAAVDAITALALEAARLRGEEHRLHEELAETRRALERSYLRPSYRFRKKVVRRLASSRPGRTMLRSYRGLRGRNSSSA
ncbi:MAG: hypothetical protein WB471_03020 [Nocardioides sp.]